MTTLAPAPDAASAVEPDSVVRSARVPRRRPELGLVAVGVAVLPIVVDPAGWYVYVAARWAYLVVAAAVGLGALVVTGRVRRPAAAGWWLALGSTAVVSALASAAPHVALWGASDRRSGAATWVVWGVMAAIGASVVRRPGDLRVVVRGVAVATLLTTAITASHRLGWSVPANAVNVSRPGGPFGNADALGAFAALALLVAIGASVDGGELDAWRLVHRIAAAGSMFCLAVSGSRGAWAGVSVGLVVLCVAFARRRHVTARRIAAVVTMSLLALVGLLLLAGAASRLGATSDALEGRVATWQRAAEAASERPVLGWGPEGLAQGFGRSADAWWERSYGRRLMPDRAHNGFVDVAAAMGLVGLIAYAGLVLVTGRAVRRALRSGSAAAIGVGAGLAAYLALQQALFQLPDVDALAWLLAGAVASLATSRPSSPRLVARRRSGRLVAFAVTGASLVAVVPAVRGVLADRDARHAVDASTRRDPEAAVVAADASLDVDAQTLPASLLADAALADGSESTLRRTRTRLDQVRRATFDDGRLTLARARLARALGAVAALEVSEREVATLVADDRARSDAWVELGRLRLLLDDDAGAADAFGEAVVLRPRRDDAWLGLAEAASREGDARRAREAIAHLDPADLDAGGRALRDRVLAGAPGQ